MLIDKRIFEFSGGVICGVITTWKLTIMLLMWAVPSAKGDEPVFSNLFQLHSELFTDHRTVSMSEYVSQRAARAEADCPSHPGSMIVVACLLCLQLVCPNCLKDIRSCSHGIEWLSWSEHFGGFKTSSVK